MNQFMAYAQDFEKTYVDDNWDRLTKHFHNCGKVSPHVSGKLIGKPKGLSHEIPHTLSQRRIAQNSRDHRRGVYHNCSRIGDRVCSALLCADDLGGGWGRDDCENRAALCKS